MRFDYLHDPLPGFVERLRGLRLPGRLYAPVVVGAAVVAIVAVADGIEVLRESSARALEDRAEVRLQATRTALRRLRLESQQIGGLLARDRRLRSIRLSGSVAAAAMATAGNAFPRGAWLTSATLKPPGGFEMKGRADDVGTLETVVRDLVETRGLGRPSGLRFSRQERDQNAGLDFEMRLGESR